MSSSEDEWALIIKLSYLSELQQVCSFLNIGTMLFIVSFNHTLSVLWIPHDLSFVLHYILSLSSICLTHGVLKLLIAQAWNTTCHIMSCVSSQMKFKFLFPWKHTFQFTILPIGTAPPLWLKKKTIISRCVMVRDVW